MKNKKDMFGISIANFSSELPPPPKNKKKQTFFLRAENTFRIKEKV